MVAGVGRAGLGEDDVDRRGGHLGRSPRDPGQDVAQEQNAAISVSMSAQTQLPVRLSAKRRSRGKLGLDQHVLDRFRCLRDGIGTSTSVSAQSPFPYFRVQSNRSYYCPFSCRSVILW